MGGSLGTKRLGSGLGITTTPGSGVFGYWLRTLGAPNTLQPANAGDQILASSGTVANPGYGFVNAPNGGLYVITAGAADTLGLAVDGIRTMAYTSTTVVVGVAGTHTLSCPGAGANSERFGSGTSTGTATGAIAVGQAATVADGATDSIALGRGATVAGVSNVVIGALASKTSGNTRCVVIGESSGGAGFRMVTVGYAAVAGDRGLAVGPSSVAGISGIAIGDSANAANGERIAIGVGTTSPGNNTFACGGTGLGGIGMRTVLFGRGDTHAGAAVTVTHRGTNGTGTDIDGDNYAIQAGLGTGAATANGSVTIATGTPLGTGTTLQTATARITVAPGGLVTMANRVQFDGQIYCPPVTLTSVTNSVAVNADDGNTFTHTMTENTTLANPTNMQAGATYIFRVVQSAGGGNTMAFDTAYLFPGGTPPTITATANAIDVITAYTPDGTNLLCTFAQDFA